MLLSRTLTKQYKTYTMKKIIAFITALICTGVFAQQGFIEIEVSDTITMKPKSMDYQVTINADTFIDYSTDDYDIDPDKLKVEMDEKMMELSLFLSKKKYSFKELTGNKEPLYKPYYVDKGYLIHANNQAELDKIMADLKTLDYISGSVKNIDYGDESPYEEELLKRLVAKANKKAKLLATQTGLTLGKIIEIKEGNKPENMFESMAVLSRLYDQSNDNVFGTLTRTLVIKYIAE